MFPNTLLMRKLSSKVDAKILIASVVLSTAAVMFQLLVGPRERLLVFSISAD